MPISDKKKVQTTINRLASAIEGVREAVDEMEAVRVLFVAHDPEVTGTALEGNKAAVATRIAALKAESDLAFWDALLAAVVPTHRGEAMS